MAKSIISNVRRCYECGSTQNLHKHHIFFGPNRNISDREGCWIYLCGYHHNLSDAGIHKDHEFDVRIKKLCQEKWMEIHGATVDDFRKVFGKNYV